MNAIPHIGTMQKQRLEAGAMKLAYASYEEMKPIISKFYVLPKNGEKIVFIFAEPIAKGAAKERTLKEEIEASGYRAISKKNLRKPHFDLPVSVKAQKKVVEEIQSLLGLSQNDLAAIIGCSPRKIWEVLSSKDGAFKLKSHVNNLNQLVKLMNQLLSIFKNPALLEWFKSPQADLKKKTPFALLASGHIDLLFKWAYMKLEGGYR